MKALKKLMLVLERLWAPLLLLLIVLACGLLVKETSLQAEVHPALSMALHFGPLI